MTTVEGSAEGARTGRSTEAVRLRPAEADELDACAEIWRVSINDYIGRIGQPEVPTEVGDQSGDRSMGC